jgi:hypothetical protein
VVAHNPGAGGGAPPPPAGALGLEAFELLVDGQEQFDGLERRLADAGTETAWADGGLAVADPSANGILVRARLSA